MRRAIQLLCFLLFACLAFADTEIRNFRLPLPGTHVRPTGELLTITPSERITLHARDNQTEFWIHLPEQSGSWTVRLSWPASSPTRFGLDVHPGKSGATIHVTAETLSVPMVHPWNRGKEISNSLDTVFHLTLEPLLLGVLPATATSAIVAILIMVALGVFLAPRAVAGIEALVLRLNEEESIKSE